MRWTILEAANLLMSFSKPRFSLAHRFVRSLSSSCAVLLLAGCGRTPKPSPAESASAAPASTSSAAAPSESTAAGSKAPNVAAPKRLTSLPISAYATTIAMDDDAVYLMTNNAAYRLVDGEPAHGIRLDLGIGPVLTRSAFVFWSNGAIWSAPKQGGVTRELAKFPHQPQYFVSSEDAVAWVDQTDDGLYTIQTLDGRQARVLASSSGEIRALNMVRDSVYFVQRPSDDAWRIGVVRLDGTAPEYGALNQGRAPSQLAGSDGIYYFSLDKVRISKLSLDLRREEVQVKDLVCSPIHVSNRIYCGCVEGLFDVTKDDTHQPRVLVHDPAGSITSLTSTARAVAWTVDLGANQLAVEMLPLPEGDGSPPAP